MQQERRGLRPAATTVQVDGRAGGDGGEVGKWAWKVPKGSVRVTPALQALAREVQPSQPVRQVMGQALRQRRASKRYTGLLGLPRSRGGRTDSRTHHRRDLRDRALLVSEVPAELGAASAGTDEVGVAGGQRALRLTRPVPLQMVGL
mmetsp:Transcript_1254/g.2007  ORF Transcript_1254/g.2007 Transcript_1254/m.2007 type:complete len:147 (+) Transcript_1254:2-442(+)